VIFRLTMAHPPSTLHLDLEDEPYKLVEIHPVVLFSILDSYIRRNENQERVIGTLLGSVSDDGTVTISNCFTVPHTEREQVAVVLAFHHTMLSLHSAVAPHEQVIGWYTTSFNNHSVLLHDFYWKVMNKSPVHLLVDPSTLDKGSLTVSCFYAIPVHVDRSKLQEHFRPLRHVIKTGQGQRTALERMIMDKEKKEHCFLSDLDGLERTLNGLIEMLDTVSTYVHSVASGQRVGDPKIGRLLEETLALLPSYENGQFDQILTKGLQDVLMVVYLGNLTRTHLLLAEQLRDQTPKLEGDTPVPARTGSGGGAQF